MRKAAGDGTVRGAAGGEKKGLGGFSVLPEDVIALGRMVGGLATNNKAAEQYKAGLKPLLIDTYENTVPITGNYFAKASADRQASLEHPRHSNIISRIIKHICIVLS